MSAGIDEISRTLGELQADMRSVRQDIQEVKNDVAGVKATVDSLDKKRLIGSGILVGIASAGSFLATKAGAVMAVIMRP